MKTELLILTKSDKNNGYCVVSINKFGKFIRLVKNFEGHSLDKEQFKFGNMDLLTVNVIPAPLINQKENYVLIEIINQTKTNIKNENLRKYIQNPEFIFSNANPWLTQEEINHQNESFLFLEITDLIIYENNEGKHKCDFTYNNNNYKGFSVTDPKFKLKNKKISKSILGVSLPELPQKIW